MRLIDADELLKRAVAIQWSTPKWVSDIAIEDAPTIDVVPKDEYMELLKAARKMHLWIFLNTADEEKAYDECGLTDEQNALLGYGGKFVINDDPELYPNHGGADDEVD